MLEKLLLEEVGQRLARQPFQGFFWQQGAKYIQVDSVISETHPLWALENKVLENELSLFGVKPQQLEQQISDYRKKSRVIRWLLRLFTRINSKIAVWSYYRQCLSFRALSQREPLSSPQKRDFPVDFTITQALLPYLRKDIYQFEEMIERHLRSVEASEDKFLLRYQACAEKQEARFLKLLEKQLKGLSSEQQTLLRNTLKEEYRGMRKMMKKFTESCLKGAKQVKEQLSPFMPNLTLPLVKSEILYAEEDRPSNNISPLSSGHGAQALADNSFNEMLPLRLEKITELLAQGDRPDQAAVVRLFLEDSFNQCCAVVKSKLDQHQVLVDEVKSGSLNYQQAILQSERLEHQLVSLFKTNLLLFHPDKQPSSDESIKEIQHALCCQFLSLRETSIRKLKLGINTIRDLIPKEFLDLKKQQHRREESLDKILQEYRDLYQGFSDDYIKFYADEKVREEARIVREEARIVRLGAMIAEIKELEVLFSAQQNQTDALDSETAAATGHSFFPAGR